MNCKLILVSSTQLVLLLTLGMYIFSKYKSRKLNEGIIKTINNTWSHYGGGNQTTEIASLANKLTEKINSSPNIINHFGFAMMIIATITSLIYTLEQIDSDFCLNGISHTEAPSEIQL